MSAYTLNLPLDPETLAPTVATSTTSSKPAGSPATPASASSPREARPRPALPPSGSAAGPSGRLDTPLGNSASVPRRPLLLHDPLGASTRPSTTGTAARHRDTDGRTSPAEMTVHPRSTPTSQVWECTRSNLFAHSQSRGRWSENRRPQNPTPQRAPASPRHHAPDSCIDLVQESRIPVPRKSPSTMHDLETANEVFLTNAVRGIMPVGRTMPGDSWPAPAPSPKPSGNTTSFPGSNTEETPRHDHHRRPHLLARIRSPPLASPNPGTTSA